jgi:F-type H+-transporting ATPase subunit gamma
MATLRDILRKIGAVKKTRQITRAMNMVAAARLRTTQVRMENFEPYAEKFLEVLENLATRIDPEVHPLLVKKEQVSKAELLHFTADRGLCGSFNMNSITKGMKWIEDQQSKGVDYGMTVIGKKGRDYFRKRSCNITASHINVYGKIDISFVNQITKDLTDRYLADEIDEVYMIYSRFFSMAKQGPTLVKLIPIEPPRKEEGVEGMAEYLCEPGDR